jgi:hypothetical protein
LQIIRVLQVIRIDFIENVDVRLSVNDPEIRVASDVFDLLMYEDLIIYVKISLLGYFSSISASKVNSIK